jgi:hypothetical protein
MLMHNHQKVTLHAFFHPIRNALALPLMFYYVLSQDEPNLQERVQGSEGYWNIVLVPPSVPDQDRAEVVRFQDSEALPCKLSLTSIHRQREFTCR